MLLHPLGRRRVGQYKSGPSIDDKEVQRSLSGHTVPGKIGEIIVYQPLRNENQLRYCLRYTATSDPSASDNAGLCERKVLGFISASYLDLDFFLFTLFSAFVSASNDMKVCEFSFGNPPAGGGRTNFGW